MVNIIHLFSGGFNRTHSKADRSILETSSDCPHPSTGYSGSSVGTPTTTLVAGSTGYTINGVGTTALNTPATVSVAGYTGGIVIPPAYSASQSSFLLLAAPAGMPIVASSSDQVSLSVPATGVNVLCNATVLGRST